MRTYFLLPHVHKYACYESTSNHLFKQFFRLILIPMPWLYKPPQQFTYTYNHLGSVICSYSFVIVSTFTYRHSPDRGEFTQKVCKIISETGLAPPLHGIQIELIQSLPWGRSTWMLLFEFAVMWLPHVVFLMLLRAAFLCDALTDLPDQGSWSIELDV